MTLDKILFVAGLVFDIVGARFLARGIARKPLRSMADESSVGWGGPPNLDYVVGTLEQKADAQIGFWLLFFGFGIQSFDYFDVFPPWSLPRWAVFLGVLVLGLALYQTGSWGSRWLFRRGSPALLAYVLRSTTENGRRKEGSEGYTCQGAEKLTPWFSRQPGEDDKAFAQRVWARIDAGGS